MLFNYANFGLLLFILLKFFFFFLLVMYTLCSPDHVLRVAPEINNFSAVACTAGRVTALYNELE